MLPRKKNARRAWTSAVLAGRVAGHARAARSPTPDALATLRYSAWRATRRPRGVPMSTP
jgi:hypothetical protein